MNDSHTLPKTPPKTVRRVKVDMADADRLPQLLDDHPSASDTRTQPNQVKHVLTYDCSQIGDDEVMTIRQVLMKLGLPVIGENRVAFNHAIERGELPRVTSRPGRTFYLRGADVKLYLAKGGHHQRRRKPGVTATSDAETLVRADQRELSEIATNSRANVPSLPADSSPLPPSVDGGVEPATLADAGLVVENDSAPDDPAISEIRADDDPGFLANQEAIVGKLANAMAHFKDAKRRMPHLRLKAEKAGIEAAEALYLIRVFKGEAPWRTFKNFEQYCNFTWGLGKSHTFRLLATGSFITRLKASQSPNKPFGDWLPVSEGQIRPMLENVPEANQAACWEEIVAKTSPHQLTGRKVKEATMEFMRRQSGEAVVEQVPKHDVKKKISKPMAKIRAAFDGVIAPDRFEHLLVGLSKLADQVDGCDAAVHDGHVAVTESSPSVTTSGVADELARVPLAVPRDKPTNVREGGESATPGPAKARRTNQHHRKSNPKTKTATQVSEESGDGCRPSDSCDESATVSSPPNCLPQSGFMNARLLHSLLQPPVDYDDWLASVRSDRPLYVHVPDDGGDALIFLEWAKSIAFKSEDTPASRLAMQLVVRALNEYQSDHGAAADALFSDALLGSNSQPEGGGCPRVPPHAPDVGGDGRRLAA